MSDLIDAIDKEVESATATATAATATENEPDPVVDEPAEDGAGAVDGEQDDDTTSDDPKSEEKKSQAKENHDFRRMKKFIEEAATAKAEAKFLREQLASRDQKQPDPANERPARDDFQTDADYIEALTDWKLTQRLPELTEAAQKEVREVESRKAREAARNEFKSSTPDFDEVMEVAETMQVNGVVAQEMGRAMQACANPSAISYYLAKNPDEFNRITQGNPARIALEIGKIEDKISTTTKPQPTAKKTAAPPPIKPPSARGTTAVPLHELSGDDFFKGFLKSEAKARKER